MKLHHPSSFCFNLSHRSQRDQHHGSSLPLTLSGSTFLLQGREATETARSSFKPSRNQRDLKHHLMTRQSHDRCLKRDQTINLCSHTLWFSHLHKPNKLSLSKDSEWPPILKTPTTTVLPFGYHRQTTVVDATATTIELHAAQQSTLKPSIITRPHHETTPLAGDNQSTQCSVPEFIPQIDPRPMIHHHAWNHFCLVLSRSITSQLAHEATLSTHHTVGSRLLPKQSRLHPKLRSIKSPLRHVTNN